LVEVEPKKQRTGDGLRDITMNRRIRTPIKVRKLQRTLYRQAKSKPQWRAWTLYGEMCRKEVLGEALWRVIDNEGAAGIDGVEIEQVVRQADTFLESLRSKLQGKTYRPQPVLRVWIPKADGKERPLGIPTVEDRVVQTAMVILLEPIFEADFHPESYGYRPGRSAHDAIESISQGLWEGRHAIVDADLSGYFDSIPHGRLLRLLKARVSDAAILHLVKAFLRAGVVERKTGRQKGLPETRQWPDSKKLDMTEV
jgi:RNA-directed DNA polymerase